MSAPNLYGVLVIEALKSLEKSSSLGEIIQKVATYLDCSAKQVEEAVTSTVNAGAQYGFIKHSKNKFAYLPINFSGLTDDDVLYGKRKKKCFNSSNNRQKTVDTQSQQYDPSSMTLMTDVYRMNKQRSSSQYAYARSKSENRKDPVQSTVYAGGSDSKKATHISRTLTRGVQKSRPQSTIKWRG